MKNRNEIKVGDYVKFIDPAIEDYDVEDREDVLNTIYRVERINGDVYLVCTDDKDVEALAHELVKVTPKYFIDRDVYDVKEKMWHGDLGWEVDIDEAKFDSVEDAVNGIKYEIDEGDWDFEEDEVVMYSVIEGIYNFNLEEWYCPPCSIRNGYTRYRLLVCDTNFAYKHSLMIADEYYPKK